MSRRQRIGRSRRASDDPIILASSRSVRPLTAPGTARRVWATHSILRAYLDHTEFLIGQLCAGCTVLLLRCRTPERHGNTVHVHCATTQFVGNLPVALAFVA